MAIDYYVEARSIIDALVSEGLVSDATTLRGAIEGGATANEILMAVRWHLQQFDKANKPINLGTKRKIRDLIVELNKVLS